MNFDDPITLQLLWNRLVFITDKAGQAGIVYCLSRKFTDEVSATLCEAGLNALPYHAGQMSEQRKINQDRFMTESGVLSTCRMPSAPLPMAWMT